MKILFTFENPLPSTAADAEVFVTTARYLATHATQSWLHVPLADEAARVAAEQLSGMTVIRAHAPTQPSALRHICCGLTLVWRKQFREADLIYTRNYWIAWLALLFGQRVVFDHYRPWPDQIPPLQLWFYRLLCNRRFLVNICHSDYTRSKYLALGIPPAKLHCVRNGFEPQRLHEPLSPAAAKQAINVQPDQKTIVYTGRINHKKGLALVLEAARRLPDLLFILVGSQGEGVIETQARGIANIRIIPWQTPAALGPYIFAADILLIPPSWQPLAKFGSTVLPLKLFLYMASGRPILAGATPDVQEVLNTDNAVLCRPDCPDALTAAIRTLIANPAVAAQLASVALAQSRTLTWEARARRIAEIITTRLQSAQPEPGTWGRAESRAWAHQSRRWFTHLRRTRSAILPPESAPPAPCA